MIISILSKKVRFFSLSPHENLIVLVKCAIKIGGAKRHKGWLICYEKVSIATNLQLLKCILLF